MSATIVCWNVNWAKPTSARGIELKKRIFRQKPEIVCISEGYIGYLVHSDHTIYSAADYGYDIIAGRRKVFLWSQNPWLEVDEVGHDTLPSGRFVMGITETSIGEARVIGLCIPWQMAHVTTGQKNCAPWEVHINYLRGLNDLLARLDDDLPLILVGDFNQRLPRGRQPWNVFQMLEQVLANRFDIWTSGNVKRLDRQPVCHVGGTRNLVVEHVSGRSRLDKSGKDLTDHDGLVCRFRFGIPLP